MRKAIIGAALTSAFVFVTGSVWAQTDTSAGQAFSTTLDVAGTNVIDQSDTGPQNAPNPSNTPNPDGYGVTAPGAFLPASPLAEVVTGPSTTRGCVVPNGCPELFAPTPGPTPLDPSLSNEVFASSDGGSATVSVLPGAAPGGFSVLDAVSSGSHAEMRCNNDTPGTAILQTSANSEVNALVIAGTNVPIPGSVGPNTQIITGLPLVILNEQTPGCASGTTPCTVTALHAQILPPSTPLNLIDLKLSQATAAITFDPDTCVCNGAKPFVTKEGKDLTGDPSDARPGDTIEYTLHVTNSGCVDSAGVTVFDRLPFCVTPTETLGGGTVVQCPDFAPICSANGSSSQCVQFDIAALAVGQTVDLTFQVTVRSDDARCGCNASGRGFDICNVVIARDANGDTSPNASSVAVCPNGPPGGGTPPPGTPAPTATPPGGPSGTGTPGAGTPGAGTPTGTRGPTNDHLITTGSGGCSLGGGSGSVGWIPVVTVGLLLAVRQWRRRASRA